MPNYHLEVSIISRGKGRSLARSLNYISGHRVKDCYLGKTYYNRREDVLLTKIYLPGNAPPEYNDIQRICEEVDKSEKRYDARTAREFKCSLPNELLYDKLEEIVEEYINECFLSNGLCAVVAIHEGRNKADPSRNNPHVHIIVPTRTIDENGFSRKKNRDYDKRECVEFWRKQWELVQNRAYERNKCPERVSCDSLFVQGKGNIEPTIHLSRIDLQKEKRGERTPSGDIKRAIKDRNEAKIKQQEQKKERQRVRYMSR